MLPAPHHLTPKDGVGKERIVAGEQPVRGRDLSAFAHPELLAQHIRVCFRGSGRDAQPGADLIVGASRSDQLDDLSLPLRETPLATESHLELLSLVAARSCGIIADGTARDLTGR
jgi:hypothetical protein